MVRTASWDTGSEAGYYLTDFGKEYVKANTPMMDPYSLEADVLRFLRRRGRSSIEGLYYHFVTVGKLPGRLVDWTLMELVDQGFVGYEE